MTDNTMALIRRAVKRVKRCPRDDGADEWWLRAIQRLSLSYRIYRELRHGQAMPLRTVVPIVPRTPPPPDLSSHPSLLRSLSFFLSFPLFLSLCRPTSRLRSVGSESLYCARYAGVGDHSLAHGVRLDYCESDRLPFSLTRRGGGPQISVSKFASFRVFNLSIGREKEGKNGDE